MVAAMVAVMYWVSVSVLVFRICRPITTSNSETKQKQCQTYNSVFRVSIVKKILRDSYTSTYNNLNI